MTLPYNNLLMMKTQQQTAPQSFIWGNDLISANGATEQENFYYFQDHLGSPMRLVDDQAGSAQRNVQNHQTQTGTPLAYDAFGLPNGLQSNSHSNPFGFTGYQMEDITGQYYAQARYYSPDVGRFSAQDVARDGFNFYQYCRANPLRFVDRNGLFGKDTHEDITRLAGGIDGTGLPVNVVDSIVRGVRLADTLDLSPFPGGTYGLHFNANASGTDARIEFAELHMTAATNIANGTGGLHPDLISLYTTSHGLIGSDIDIGSIANNIMREYQSGNRVNTSGNTDKFTYLMEQAVIYAFNCPEIGGQMRKELALLHLGVGLHALQDIHAHGQMGAGSLVGRGHAANSVAPYLSGLGAAAGTLYGNPLAGVIIGLLLAQTPDPDSLNYDWKNDSRRLLQRTNLNEISTNPRSLAAILSSENFLRLFIAGVNDTSWLGIECD